MANCLTECLKRLLGRDDVPDYADDYCDCAGAQINRTIEYLGNLGLSLVRVKYDASDISIAEGATYILIVSVMDGEMHAVLCSRNKVIYDSLEGEHRIYRPEYFWFIVKKTKEGGDEGN